MAELDKQERIAEASLTFLILAQKSGELRNYERGK
jgi:hypothetical protein